MAETKTSGTQDETVLRVVDVLDHPHGGRIARVRLERGSMPTAEQVRGSTFLATGPRGEERRLVVLGFALTGGKASTERMRTTGRADLHVAEEGDGPPIDLTWHLTPD